MDFLELEKKRYSVRKYHFDPQKIRDLFSLPENIIPVALFPIGYPHEESVPHKLHEERFEISETVIYNFFKK